MQQHIMSNQALTYEVSHAASNTTEHWLNMYIHHSSEHLFVVLQVVPVTIDEYSLQGYYSCPVYTNMQRANVYSPIVSNFTMKTDEPSHKWVLASVGKMSLPDFCMSLHSYQCSCKSVVLQP